MACLENIRSLASVLYLRNIGFRNVMLSGGKAVRTRVGPNCANLLVRNLRKGVRFPARRFLLHYRGKFGGGQLPSLRAHISHIFLLSSPFKMVRVGASRVVARMHCNAPFRVAVARQYKGHVSSFDIFASKPKISILSEGRTSPIPALYMRRARENSAKSFGPCSTKKFFYQTISHVVSPYVRGQGRALLTQRFRPAFSSGILLCSQEKEAMK